MTDRILRAFGDVKPGEGRDALLFVLNVFLLLVAYYIIKTVREPLILTTGGAELKSYAAAAQAAVLLLYVPAYGWLAGHQRRDRLIVTVLLFFVACLQLFVVGGMAGLPIGFVFYVWVGIFSLTAIAQFWSYANDFYTRPEGDRLFPLIAIGSTAGAPIGAFVAEEMFAAGLSPWAMLEIASALLLVHLWLYRLLRGHEHNHETSSKPVSATKANGFSLVLRSSYLRAVAVLLVLLNIVNTVGEYILGAQVTAHAQALHAADPSLSVAAHIGAFYGSYFFWVNVFSVVVQGFVVSRLVKALGFRGVLFALPIVAFGAYGMAAMGAGILLIRIAKTIENGTDYSVMNTAKQMLWLPTTREEKYKGKQAVDTFFVRSGDMLAAGVVFVGTHIVALSSAGFALVNLVVLALSLAVAVVVLREYRLLTANR